MSLCKLFRAAVVLPAILLLCACPQVDPVNPGGPDGPDGPDTPENPDTPAGEYFRLKQYNYETGRHELDPPELIVLGPMGDDFAAMMVETNIDDWSVTSSEPWCKAEAYSGMLSIMAEQYGTGNQQLYPRSCEVRIKAGKVYDSVITVAQESSRYPLIYTPGNWSEYTLPSSGAPLDIYIIATAYDWQIRNPHDWITAEKINRTTLRVAAIPGETQQKRSGEIIVFSVADAEPKPLRYCTITLTEGDPDLTGEGYGYGNNLGWD